MNDESDPLKCLIIGNWVDYIGDQYDIEHIAELFEVSPNFLSILSSKSVIRVSGWLMVAAKALLPHRPTNCITSFEDLLHDMGSDEAICTSNLICINNTIP